MSVVAMPTDPAALDAWIDRRIARAERERPRLQLTIRQKCVVGLFVLFMAVSVAVWYGGFTAYRTEIDARLDGNCQTVVKVRTALENVLLAATAPRSEDTAKDDPARLKSIRDLNATLLAAREKYLPPIRALTCD